MTAIALRLAVGAAAVTVLDVGVVNVAMPAIRGELGLTAGQAHWLLFAYAVAFCLVMVPANRAGAVVGRRAMFLVGVLGFGVAGAAAALASGPSELIAARVAQGVAAGIVSSQVAGFIQQLYPPRDRARPFGVFGAVVGVASAAGPVLGGFIADGWRWFFAAEAPLGLIAALLGWRLLPGGRDRGKDLDPVAALLLGAGLAVLLVPLMSGSSVALAVFCVLPVGALVVWERRYRGTPLVDVGLFAAPAFRLGTLIAFLYFAAFTMTVVVTALLLAGMGFSALAAALVLSPFAAGALVAAGVKGRPLVPLGLALTAAGAAGLLAVRPGWAMTVPLLVAGIGSGLVIGPNQMLTITGVPAERMANAGAVVQTAQRAGTAAGIAVAALAFPRMPLVVACVLSLAAFAVALMLKRRDAK